MSENFTAACVQFTAGSDSEPNLRMVRDLVRRARDVGADLIMTPEASNFVESGRRRREKARREADDPFLTGMRSVARETGVVRAIVRATLTGLAVPPSSSIRRGAGSA